MRAIILRPVKGEVNLYWPCRVALLGGREIILDLVPGAEEQDIRLIILGPAMALLLHQRGFDCPARQRRGPGVWRGALPGEFGLGEVHHRCRALCPRP
jgi:hypothetical protein